MKSKIYNSYGIFYLIVSLFLFVFVNYNESTEFKYYIVPFIEGKVVIIHFVFSFFSFCFLLAFSPKKMKIDTVAFLLLLKALLDIVAVWVNFGTVSEYLSWVVISVSSFICYFIMSNLLLTQDWIDKIYRCIIVFGGIVCFQVIYTYFNLEISYSDVTYKVYMNIPIGGTNVITSFLIPIMALVFLSTKKNKFKVPLMLLFGVAIVLTRSRGGMILAFAVLAFLMFFYKKSNKINLKMILGISVIIACVFVLFSNDDVLNIFRGYASLDNININSITSGRISLWASMFRDFNPKYWLLGTGMKPIIGEQLTGAHNIAIDIIVRCGFIGGTVYILALTQAFKNGIKSNKDNNDVFFLLAMIILVNSMFDVCYFYYCFDCIFWMYLGLASCAKDKTILVSDLKNNGAIK